MCIFTLYFRIKKITRLDQNLKIKIYFPVKRREKVIFYTDNFIPCRKIH